MATERTHFLFCDSRMCLTGFSWTEYLPTTFIFERHENRWSSGALAANGRFSNDSAAHECGAAASEIC